ncbi:hypothetical protein BHE74_00006551, partial [Ensete ventricosum]
RRSTLSVVIRQARRRQAIYIVRQCRPSNHRVARLAPLHSFSRETRVLYYLHQRLGTLLISEVSLSLLVFNPPTTNYKAAIPCLYYPLLSVVGFQVEFSSRVVRASLAVFLFLFSLALGVVRVTM